MQTLSIGRDASNNVVLNDNMVSRHHAQLIIMDNGQVMIKDLGSSNGTFVNGKKIAETYLNAGDVVKCGGTFVNWAQYAGGIPSWPQEAININYQQETPDQTPDNISTQQFS